MKHVHVRYKRVLPNISEKFNNISLLSIILYCSMYQNPDKCTSNALSRAQLGFGENVFITI